MLLLLISTATLYNGAFLLAKPELCVSWEPIIATGLSTPLPVTISSQHSPIKPQLWDISLEKSHPTHPLLTFLFSRSGEKVAHSHTARNIIHFIPISSGLVQGSGSEEVLKKVGAVPTPQHSLEEGRTVVGTAGKRPTEHRKPARERFSPTIQFHLISHNKLLST